MCLEWRKRSWLCKEGHKQEHSQPDKVSDLPSERTKRRILWSESIEAQRGADSYKSGLPTEKYGGLTTRRLHSGYSLDIRRRRRAMLCSYPLNFLSRNAFWKTTDSRRNICASRLGKYSKKNVDSVEAVLNKRIIRVNSVIYADGLRMLITSKTNGGKGIGVSVMRPLF